MIKHLLDIANWWQIFAQILDRIPNVQLLVERLDARFVVTATQSAQLATDLVCLAHMLTVAFLTVFVFAPPHPPL